MVGDRIRSFEAQLRHLKLPGNMHIGVVRYFLEVKGSRPLAKSIRNIIPMPMAG